VAAAAVVVGTTLICVFAHCWRQILDGKRRGGRGVKSKMCKDEEAWFYRAEFGLPLPQIASPRLEPQSASTSVPKKPTARAPHEPSSGQVALRHDQAAPAVHARPRTKSGFFGSRAKPNKLRKNPASGLPSWRDSEEHGRPRGDAHCMEHHSSFASNRA
jgi:hypothetical protein